jgi:hypothetical protein
MTQYQIERANVIEAVATHFDENEILWKTKKPIVRDVNLLKAIATELKQSSQLQQGSDTRGYTANGIAF